MVRSNRKRPHDITDGEKPATVGSTDEDTETCTTESTKVDDPVDDDSNFDKKSSPRRLRSTDRHNDEIFVHHPERATDKVAEKRLFVKKENRTPIERKRRPRIQAVFEVEEFPPIPATTTTTVIEVECESISPQPTPVKVTQSPSTPLVDQPSVATPATTSSNNAAKQKCVVCKTRMLLESCSQQACLTCCTDLENCGGHKKRRQQANFKAQILEGTHFVQKEAARIRDLKIPPESRKYIREPNIIYQGETIVIWDIRTYMRNPKWREDAQRKSIKRLTSSIDQGRTTRNSPVNGRTATAKNGGTGRRGKSQLSTDLINVTSPKSHQFFGSVIRNNRQRFHTLMEKLYQESLSSTDSKTSGHCDSIKPVEIGTANAAQG